VQAKIAAEVQHGLWDLFQQGVEEKRGKGKFVVVVEEELAFDEAANPFAALAAVEEVKKAVALKPLKAVHLPPRAQKVVAIPLNEMLKQGQGMLPNDHKKVVVLVPKKAAPGKKAAAPAPAAAAGGMAVVVVGEEEPLEGGEVVVKRKKDLRVAKQRATQMAADEAFAASLAAQEQQEVGEGEEGGWDVAEWGG